MYEIPTELLLAVLYQETRLTHYCPKKKIIHRGQAGEVGIAQIMPATFFYAKQQKWIPADYNLWKLQDNIFICAKILSVYYKRVNGNFFKIACLYNAGNLKRIPKSTIKYAQNIIILSKKFKKKQLIFKGTVLNVFGF